tara:strand:- start:3856 stop:4191 length:336 start_codon:yes stop_codon:yes gene_type:complete
MNYELQGTLIVKNDTVQVSEKFKKREFVIETSEESNGQTYTETIKFQSVQAKCDLLDSVNVGEEVKITFNLKGKKWEKNGETSYFNNLDAWKVERIGEATPQNNSDNDEPF